MPQEVVTNLMISHIEVRGEEDADVAAHRHAMAREVHVVRPCQEIDAARSMLMQSFRRIMNQLATSKVVHCNSPWRTMIHQSTRQYMIICSAALTYVQALLRQAENARVRVRKKAGKP